MHKTKCSHIRMSQLNRPDILIVLCRKAPGAYRCKFDNPGCYVIDYVYGLWSLVIELSHMPHVYVRVAR